MKLNKKTVTLLSFTLGTTLFLSTAFADAMIGSGYDHLKDSIKTTASQMEQGLDNYTTESMYTFKDNGEIFMQASERVKMDLVAKATEKNTISQYGNTEPSQNYSYQDKTRNIWKDQLDGTYTVMEYDQGINWKPFTNPFKEQGAGEIEKVFDAVVGNLKDYVQAEDREDGGKMYSGNLSEAQVPALINAVASFGIKQILADEGRADRNIEIPQIESDIYVKKVAGVANESKNKVLENLTGEVVLVGKDKAGKVHELSVSVVMRLSDVGQTKIVLPDLTGATVTKSSQGNFGFSSKYVGVYRNDIIMEKNGQFVKAGVRKLEITSVDQNRVAGKYTETPAPGFEAELAQPLSFVFDQTFDTKEGPSFTYTATNGEQGAFHLYPNGNGRVYMNMDYTGPARNRSVPYEGDFIRVFE